MDLSHQNLYSLPSLHPHLLFPTHCAVAFFASFAAFAEPVKNRSIHVIDGDTIVYQGQTVRLVGFDTPESGSRARCESERSQAAVATFRLRNLVASGGLDLTIVPCACPLGTEGTLRCNFGRAPASSLQRTVTLARY
jgi:endonuclease YncB( thermonuclease family)